MTSIQGVCPSCQQSADEIRELRSQIEALSEEKRLLSGMVNHLLENARKSNGNP